MQAQPVVSVIIDDIGHNISAAKRIAELPYPVTCAVLPHVSAARESAAVLSHSGKELILHLPMQGRAGQPSEKHALMVDMDEATFKATLRENIDFFPSIVGLNSHQGSVLTASFDAMHWMMQELSLIDNFYFIDSRTTNESKAADVAVFYDVSFAERDVFLDHQPNEAFIRKQFKYFIHLAKEKGHAIAIGHPYQETLTLLEELLPTLDAEGIKLVPASYIVSLLNKDVSSSTSSANKK